MGERDIIRALRDRFPSTPAGNLVLGIGDDCAIYRPQQGEDLVFTTDLLIEGVHFQRTTHSPRDVGWKALARGLSDIAAMAAIPRFCLLSLSAPRAIGPTYLSEIFDGLAELAAQAQCALAGGDLAAGPLLFCDIVVCGSVPQGQALRRDAAKPGDLIWVTGDLGGAALGLETKSGAAWQRHLRPLPRLDAAARLRPVATAAIDLSDGLSIDLARLCEASGVGAQIHSVPVFPGATIEQALHGGEDYELLFTARQLHLPNFIRIGEITAEPGKILFRNQPLQPLGYDHFR